MDVFKTCVLVFGILALSRAQGNEADDCDKGPTGPSTTLVLNSEFDHFAMDTVEGEFTQWFDFDQVTPYSMGEYEGLTAVRNEEARYNQCLMPCEEPIAYEVMFKDTGDTDAGYILNECLDFKYRDRLATEGFVCSNAQQFKMMNQDNLQNMGLGHCNELDPEENWDDPICSAALPSNCWCPDARVRYFCLGSREEQDEYCISKGRENIRAPQAPVSKRSINGRERRSLSTVKRDIMQKKLRAMHHKRMNEK